MISSGYIVLIQRACTTQSSLPLLASFYHHYVRQEQSSVSRTKKNHVEIEPRQVCQTSNRSRPTRIIKNSPRLSSRLGPSRLVAPPSAPGRYFFFNLHTDEYICFLTSRRMELQTVHWVSDQVSNEPATLRCTVWTQLYLRCRYIYLYVGLKNESTLFRDPWDWVVCFVPLRETALANCCQGEE